MSIGLAVLRVAGSGGDPMDDNGPLRREVLKVSLVAAGLTLGGGALAASPGAVKMGSSPLVQPSLPFAPDALAPTISERTIGFHYGKHHKAYFDNLNKLVAGTPMAKESLETIIVQTAEAPDKAGVFNNAAQAWNHNFYWLSLSSQPQSPSGKLAAAIDQDFGSLESLKTQLSSASTGRFGAGWGWLVLDRGKLKVVSTSNADLPFIHGQTPLLTVDVWEHAYYLDYQNRRADYVGAVVGKTLNWDFAARNFDAA
jgi:superoxide dismutase, Fe-Mn family